MLLKWRRDMVVRVERPVVSPATIVMNKGSLSVDWLTRWLLPGLGDAFEAGDRITLITAVLSFRKEPLLALNVTNGMIVKPARWRLWVSTIAPVLLLMPVLGQIGYGVALAFLAASVALACVLDIAVARAATDLRYEAGRGPLVHALRSLGMPVDHIDDEPDPDWERRLLDRWNGDLGEGYRKSIGPVNLVDGRVLVGEPGSLAHAHHISVPPGNHEVWVSVARFSKDERISHAFLEILRGTAVEVEPMLSARGEPISLGVDGGLAAFASSTAARNLATASGGSAAGDYLLVKVLRDTRAQSIRFAVPDSNDVVAAFRSGYGDGIYPVVKLLDDQGKMLAVAIDFHV